MNHKLEEPVWEKLSIVEEYPILDVPAYHLGGWYDCFLGPTLKNFTEMREKAPGERARTWQKLIIGPGAHGVFTPVIQIREAPRSKVRK
ncbi:hypothetical protein skT53_04950 [Effusibacillus dendaii]|uniref:Xaa-Pro dipeptidyl-peptidase-like domain-containing protein n=1 Tax=Effusibacillus dendaii TaxID=2743772 RepID=A0A7I8DAF7_9BACL|nr:hypothetical protein skT53_04950 [Effusibacillus dendaii]